MPFQQSLYRGCTDSYSGPYYAKLECKDWLDLAMELCSDHFLYLMSPLDITDEDTELDDIFPLLCKEWNSEFNGHGQLLEY